jgi:hypothetical protein
LKPYDGARRFFVNERFLGHQDRPSILRTLARDGQIPAETDEDAAAIHGVACSVCGAIRAHPLRGRSEIEHHAGRPPEQTTVELE